MNNIPQQ